jgi:hypothetical protein
MLSNYSLFCQVKRQNLRTFYHLTALLKFVLIIPGAIEFTRMPSDPNSFAKTFVKAKRAVLLIEYTPRA